jgi:hypothetical protein
MWTALANYEGATPITSGSESKTSALVAYQHGLKTMKIVACVTHHFSRDRFTYLRTTIEGLKQSGIDTTVICTNATQEEQAEVNELLSGSADVRLLSFTSLGHPYQLTMYHRLVFRHLLQTDPSITHFLYTEDDHLFNAENIKYWVTCREELETFDNALIPGWFRVERSSSDGKWYSVDYHQSRLVSESRLEKVKNGYYVDSVCPYAGAYMLDRLLMSEFSASEHFLHIPQPPREGRYYAVREHAAFGMAWTNLRHGSFSRYRLRLSRHLDGIDPSALIEHLPGNYTAGGPFDLRPVREFNFIESCS